jgi:aspartyl/asparaginyl-tRNA synthetase
MKEKDFFIVVNYFKRPRDPGQTRLKGYFNNVDNFYWAESVNITRGLKTRDRDRAELILNLNKQEVLRNSKGNDETFAELLYYFQKNYPDNINPVLAYIYPEETKNENDVQTTEETSSGSERSSETDTVGSREGNEGVQNAV